jgi:hypothetical protein
MIMKGLVLGASIFAAGLADAIYDPTVELFPGRAMPLSQVNRTVAVWDTAVGQLPILRSFIHWGCGVADDIV